MRRWLDKRKGRFTYEEEKVSESTKMVFRAVDASYYIHVNEKKLYPRKIWIVNFLLSFVVAYLFMVSALDFSYFGCYFTSDIPNQCTLWPGLTNIVIALVINIVLALVVPYWILMLLSDWVYDLGKKTESELMRQTVKTLEQDGSIDAKCAEVVTNGIMSMHWSPSERMMAAINTSNDNNKDG
ncbi:MAG: hypothetical protein HYV33_02425 [Candidatus Kerfeldbacteria bacterium]|nr:hypothetical protein [Candidatus Kerfeldbacteria bacterium]